MSDPFKNPLTPKQKVNGKRPWSYAAPTKDQATSGNLPLGDYYGVGHKTPVGTETASSYESGPIPLKSKCIDPRDMIDGER